MMQMTVLAMIFIPKRKKSGDNKKKYETKRIRKFQPAWQKEFDWAVYQEETWQNVLLHLSEVCWITKRSVFFNFWSSVSLILWAKMKYEVYILPFSIVVVAYFWTSSFVVRTSKILIVLVRRDKWIGKKVSCPGQVSINHNMDVQYQRRTRQSKAACLCQPIIWSMAAMLRDSVAIVITVMHTHPQQCC